MSAKVLVVIERPSDDARSCWDEARQDGLELDFPQSFHRAPGILGITNQLISDQFRRSAQSSQLDLPSKNRPEAAMDRPTLPNWGR